MMKKVLLLITSATFILLQGMKAQSQIVMELSNGVTDLVGSFLDDPYHHDNTVNIYDLTKKAKTAVEELSRKAPYGSSDYYSLQNMQTILKVLEHITAGVLDRYPASVDANDFESLNPIFDSLGWNWKVIHSTSDIILYEYQKGLFKMVIAKNTLPKKNGGDYNAVSYNCYAWSRFTKKNEMFTGRVLFGGNCQFVECCDDKTKYTKITKVSSKRGAN